MKKLEVDISASYERVVAVCNHCGHRNVLSRVDDIKSTEPVGGKDITCEKCNVALWITGDTVNPAYEMLLMDCGELMAEKRYIYCILNVCQAYEMFFSQYIRYTLQIAPYATDRNLAKMKEIEGLLRTKLADFTFRGLRNTFLRWAACDLSCPTYAIAEVHLESLDPRQDEPSNAMIKRSAQPDRAKLLLAVKDVKVNEIRNDVVHHLGYRPTKQQAEDCFKEAWRLFLGLSHAFKLTDDYLSWYRASN